MIEQAVPYRVYVSLDRRNKDILPGQSSSWPSTNGPWCIYSDHLREVAEYKAELKRLEDVNAAKGKVIEADAKLIDALESHKLVLELQIGLLNGLITRSGSSVCDPHNSG